MQKLLLFMLLIAVCMSAAQAQDTEIKVGPALQVTPYDHLKSLKHGVLLVRLKTSQKKIDALNKIGRTAWARKVEREQHAENKRIISAFKKHYTFSPVYFFYSNDSDKILAKQFDGVVLNADLQPAFRNGYFPGNFLVAEIGLIGNAQRGLSDSGELSTESSGSQSSTIEGLVLSDEHLMQLADPFPYFVRSFKSLGPDLRRSEDRMVEKLNRNLFRFSKNSPQELRIMRYHWQR